MIDVPLPLIALSAGILSVFSPCILPVLPLIAAYSTKSGKYVPVTIVIGLTTSFTMMGVLTSAFGYVFNQYQTMLYTIAGVVVIFLGYYMIFDEIEQKIRMIIPNTRISRRFSATNAGSTVGGFMFGFSLGIIWIPCVGPILAVILAMVAVAGSMLYGGILLAIYSLGLGIPLLLLAYIPHFTLKPLNKYSLVIKRIAGVIMVQVGTYMVVSVYFT